MFKLLTQKGMVQMSLENKKEISYGLKIGSACTGVLRYVAFTLVVSSLLAGCGKKPPAPLQADYAGQAIQLNLMASPKLNFHDGKAHALVLCVYQLSDPGVFSDTIENPTGLDKLLACEAFDPTVRSRKRIVLDRPGGDKRLVLDRVQGTRYLGIVAGYYDRLEGSCSEVIQVPVAERRTGFLWLKKTRYLDMADTTIFFGAKGKVVQVPVVERRTGFLWLKKTRYLDTSDTTIFPEANGLEVQ
jgi:type VI secretion system VasD/TssJ family lipoprotein